MMKGLIKITNGLRSMTLIFLAVLSFGYAMIQGGFVSWFLFAAFLPIVLYCSILFFYPVEKIQVERELVKKEYVAGETVSVRLLITLPWRLPLPYLYVHDRMIRKRKNNVERSWHSLQFPFFKKSFTCEYEIPRIARGEFSFTEVDCTIADLFGFVRKSHRVHVESHMIVYPSTIPIQMFPEAYEFEYGLARTKDTVQRDTTVAVSVREYQQGDRFSWINWKATARKNELMTKEFEQRKNQDVLFVLDRTPCAQFEFLVTFCASMITAVLKASVETGLYSFGEEREYIPTRQGETQRKKIFRALARVEDDAILELAKVIQSDILFRQHFQHTVFIVSTLKIDLVSELMQLTNQRRHVSVYIVKGKREQLQREEFALLTTLKQKGIVAELVRDGEFTLSRGEVG